MDDVLGHSRKPVVCRYFAASGTCFYGNDCQFLHNADSRSNSSPTFSLNSFTSPTRTGSSTGTNQTEDSHSILESNGPPHSYGKNADKLTFSHSIVPTKDEYISKTEGLPSLPVSQTPVGPNSSLFEVIYASLFPQLFLV